MGTSRDWALAAVAAWLRRYGFYLAWYACLALALYCALTRGTWLLDRE